MFVSRQLYRMPIPLGLAEPGEQYWRVVEMAMPLPWFIATVELGDKSERFQRSFCISWESDLVEMLASNPGVKPISLQLVQPPSNETQGWRMHAIARLWRLRESTSDGERPQVVLQTTDGALLCPASGDELQPDLGDRDVIVDLT